MLGHTLTLSQPAENFTLVFPSCLYRNWRWTRGESLGHRSQVLPMHSHSPGHVRSPTHVHDFLNSKRYAGIFQSLYRLLIPQLFLLSFLVSLLFASLLTTASDSHKVKHLPLHIFDKSSQGKGFLHLVSCKLGQIKTALQVGFPPEPSNRWNNNSSLGMWLRRSSNHILSSHSFTMIVICCFSMLLWSSQEGDGNRANATKLTLLLKIHLFFLNEHSSDCYKPLITSKVLKKLIQTMYQVFSLLLWRRELLEGLTPSFSMMSPLRFFLHQ